MKQNKIFAAVLTVAMIAAGTLAAIPAPAKAALSNGASADVVIGQQNMTATDDNQGGSAGANTIYAPRGIYSDGQKLFIVDSANNRVLIYNTIPTSNNASADVVVGQQNMTAVDENQGGSIASNTLRYPYSVYSDGQKLFVADSFNNRVLIYNSIPTSNNASADVVIGQTNMTSGSANQGGAAGANTLEEPTSVYSDGIRLVISDVANNRVLIYNTIPTSNNASADVVVGQQNMTSNSANQGGSDPTANTLGVPYGVGSNGKKLFIADWGNNRVLIYNSIPTANNTAADVVVGQSSMTTNDAPSAASATTLFLPSEVCSFGKKLAVSDRLTNRVTIYNNIPTSNGEGANVVLGQANTTGDDEDQGGAAGAATLDEPRGIACGGTKLFVGDYDNNRVLIYDAGPQYAIGKNKSATLWNGEKMKVKKKKFEFSGKRTDLKKGRVRLLVSGSSKKVVKIKKSGKWSLKYRHKTNETVLLRFKYYNSSGTNVENPETYVVQVSHSGSLTPVMLKSADFEPMSYSETQNMEKTEKINMKDLSW
ncbi:MAG: hypothetical protein QMD77_04300 [Patescibacteria group bacterium]|nr:hypothetical protein [Patescibacteria group bacterium]